MARTNLQMSLLAVSVGLAFAASSHAAVTGQSEAVARLRSESGAAEVTIHSATGSARFVRAAQGGMLASRTVGRGANDAAKQVSSVQFLSDYGNLFGIRNASTELVTGSITRDRQGGTHISHQQVYQGVPVYGAELKSHYDAAGNLVVVNGTFVPDIAVSSQPSRSADQAAAAALALVQGDLASAAGAPLSASRPVLVVYRENLTKGIEGANHLAWQVEVGNKMDVRQLLFIDAQTGRLIDKINGIHEAKNRRAFDAAGATAPGANYPNSPLWVEGQPFPTGVVEADNMLNASSDIYDLFKLAFGRDSFDGQGARMDSIYNRGNGCPNASWNGTFISFCPGLTTDDVTAHEWGHAYTQYTHGLIYAWQSGALNESYSDIWGETVDRINGRGTDAPDNPRSANACTVFSPAPTTVTVNSPAAIAGSKPAGTADFGAQTFALTNALAGVGVGTANAGCTLPFAENVSGKIAFIDRGTCGFAVKALNAQQSGAIGVVIGNNQLGDTVSNMTGGSASNTIPVLMVSQNNGTAIKAQLAGGVNVTMTRGGSGTDNSVRWLIGEDSTAPGLTGALRDMYNPTCYSNPGKVSDTQYTCDAGNTDSGGVHTNSGVPNHAYALIVDGGTYNGQTISGIGLTKAAHMYFRAQTVYQGPTTTFPGHADAIEQSCRDLTGTNLNDLKTGLPSGQIITATDCAQVTKAMLAVEMRAPVTQCGFTPILAQNPPALCPTGTASTLASDGFDGGKKGGLKWLLANVGSAPEYAPNPWAVTNGLPGARPGYAIFAANPDVGTCAAGGDQSGLARLESPEIVVPAGTSTLRLSFDHWVATESGWDGGNVKISVNGGAWQLISAANFVFNPYNTTLNAAPGNTNPLAGQGAFSGTDGGSTFGSWGRSIVNLAPYAVSGDRVKLRFELGRDGCGGSTFGWYLDDVNVYRCVAPQ